MAAFMVPTILITRKPYLLFRKPIPRRSPICSRSKNSVIIASSSSSFRNGSPPETDCPVPWDQQPVNEYTALSTSFPFSWAAADLRDYCTRLTLVGSSFAILFGLPVAAFGTGAVANTSADALRCGVGATSAGIISVTFVVLRMYLGWAYVGNRLLSATVEYEETGWYDGQIWVKTPEVLARDRLLGSFSNSVQYSLYRDYSDTPIQENEIDYQLAALSPQFANYCGLLFRETIILSFCLVVEDLHLIISRVSFFRASRVFWGEACTEQGEAYISWLGNFFGFLCCYLYRC